MELSQTPTTSSNGYSLRQNDTAHTIETRYMEMLLELDSIPWFYSILADGANWMLLAGYLVLPGTFTSLQDSQILEDSLKATATGQKILSTIQNPPLLAIAGFFLVSGAFVMTWLAWERRNNYIWLLNRLFIPTLLNAASGLIATLINVYTAQGGSWSIMALMATIVTALTVSVSLGLFIIYRFGKLLKIRQEHDREMIAEFHRVHT
ncbi:hypothetical protein BO82DRAFT_384260 [Aspergillus uvarum CBS 121591]|uniref:Uncharacterized protein n=3 Tax=Aspergillus TaxID=5052 RepID=A0A319C5M9_9EURO|nr:hypothetical protein BO82DRAFT_384260 [Aspergillus uvarum CBS 121591]PYH80575.1 hypothetical protein BO82DRAFT_384260 [Aspergillus uvarum CBS 121591]PYI13427.1 hypothetical protein BO99DRAFT_452745 [Aspergillus violaceofuscus CBS 115571]